MVGGGAARRRSNLISLLISVMLLPSLASAQTAFEANCGDPEDSGGVGPFDFQDRMNIRHSIDIVVDHHFTPYMEELALSGATMRQPRTKEELQGGGRLGIHHLDYTLRAIPNHTRALNAMGVWQLRLRQKSMDEFWQKMGRGDFKTAECYFKRAIMFRPDDGSVRLVYGIFLHRQGRGDLALQNYEAAIRLMPAPAESHYNIGLLLVELKNYDLAREHAKKAYALGYPMPGLKNALMRHDEWEDSDAGSGGDTQ